ncbi:uncharacterized protein [Diadema setosum]|uniref:uncharacterized protein n=1 Tax=Diadema setosum TaxID=31175 RepID=UPI003B3AF398
MAAFLAYKQVFKIFRRVTVKRVIWCLFLVLLISLVLTYVNVVSVLDEENTDRAYKDFFQDRQERSRHAGGDDFGDLGDLDMAASRNLISSRIIEASEISIEGWWMSHARWDYEIDCDAGRPGLCAKVLKVSCSPDSVRSIYQFLPVSPHIKLKGVQFSARSAASNLKKHLDVGGAATFSAVAFLKYTDNSHERLRLEFPGGTHPFLPASVNKTLLPTKTVESITVMLCCYGYEGHIKVSDVELFAFTDTRPSITPLTRDEVVLPCTQGRPASVPKKPSYHTEHVLTADNTQIKFNDVTLITHASLDRIDGVLRMLSSWEAPCSISLYLPIKADEREEDIEWKKLYVFKKMRILQTRTDIDLTLVYSNTMDDVYPINYMRNVAISHSKTKYILLLDADFLPSPTLHNHFLQVIEQWPTAQGDGEMKTAFVVPAFDYIDDQEAHASLPATKAELIQLMKQDPPTVSIFRFYESPLSHGPTNYAQWYTASEPYHTVYYEDKYEPYLILQKSEMPMYDERFTGYGMNKITHIFELHAAGYEFVVLPDAWVIHFPHSMSSQNARFLSDPISRLTNRVARLEFVADVMRKYGVGPCKGSPT